MSEQIKITGTVKEIMPVQEFSGGFYKQVLVVDTGQQYDPFVPIEFKKEKTDLLKGLGVGSEVTVYINIGGREYNGRYYADISGWKLDRLDGSQAQEGVQEATGGSFGGQGSTDTAQEDADSEIPF
jgi:hypothetical protein